MKLLPVKEKQKEWIEQSCIRLWLVVFILNCLLNVQAQEPKVLIRGLTPINPDDPKGLQLGPGVPRVVDTNGNVIELDVTFTTKEYQRAAFNLVLEEANRVAREMELSENLPITVSNITGAYISPFGCSYRTKAIGNITTSNYTYYVSEDKKFNQLDTVNYDQTCLQLEKQKLPINLLDTNAPYQLATQWLASASMDVNGLNRYCKAHVVLTPFWNGLSRLGDTPEYDFVPIYLVWWSSPEEEAEGRNDAAYVELFLPTKKLLQLCVDDPKYIARKPLIFTNLPSLFPGTARILTNHPPKVQVVGPPPT